jgi:type III secretory pathway component EscU
MSEEKHTSSSPEELNKTKKRGDVKLSEQDLAQVSGGAVDSFLNLDGIKGESTDDKHKGLIE